MTDIEIARNTKLEKIVDIAKKVNISEENIEQYGNAFNPQVNKDNI